MPPSPRQPAPAPGPAAPTDAPAAPIGDVALFALFPQLRGRIPWARLGHWPTPVHALPGLAGACDVYVKREDLSSPRYGGNKVRTLEAALGQAIARDAGRVWATGAYGSNHALATAVHAPAVGLDAGAALFPQPSCATSRANLSALLAARPALVRLHSVVELPFAMAALRRRRPEERPFVMSPGFACPEGALGALSAALELAGQIAAGDCPAPERIVLAAGSTCTTAGLLAGLHLAGELGIGFGPDRVPAVTTVRVTPWPVTSRTRIVYLALRTVDHLARLLGRPRWATPGRLRGALTVERRYFGAGYARATAAGERAAAAFRAAGGPPLDVVYSAKSGAALLDLAGRGAAGPLLFWATKSSAPLSTPTAADLALAPPEMIAWSTPPAPPA